MNFLFFLAEKRTIWKNRSLDLFRFLLPVFFPAFFTFSLISCESLDYLRYAEQGKNLMQLENVGANEINLEELDKVNLSGFSISDYHHPLVKKYIHDYERYGKSTLEAIMRRSQPYLPTIKQIFREKQIPEDLAYLPIIESGFNIRARSSAGAVGLWQFTYGTGILYKLRANYWYDQRMDFYKSTYAAAYHLRYLYKVFDNWLLALAAYNAGVGKIGRAVKRYKTRNFWELAQYPYIKKETGHYPAKFIAALTMIKNRHRYALNIEDEKNLQIVKLKTLTVQDATDLKLLAELAAMPVKNLKGYNTSLLRWATPPKRSFPLYIPEHKYESLKNKLANIPADKRITFRRYFVSIGDSLSNISKKLSVPVNPIAEINNLKSLNDIRAGSYLILPIEGLKKAKSLDTSKGKTRQERPIKSANSKKTLKEREYVFLYISAADDSLYSVARKFSLSLQDVMLWNELKRPEHLRPGMVLVIKMPWAKKDELQRKRSFFSNKDIEL